MLPSFISETQSSWEFLKNTHLPIFIYGMGDGAVKILNVFDRYGIAPAGFFASDEFVRGHSFMGHLVHKLSDIENAVDDFIAVLAFGAGYRSLYDRILDIASRHTLLAPDVPVVGDTLFTPEYCSENAGKIQAVYDLLADDLSRQTYADVINSKISGKIGYLDRCTSDSDEVFSGILRLSDHETYIDMGAYNGDTVLGFVSACGGSYDRIYAPEPDERNFRKLEKNVSELPRVHIFNAAAWSEDTELDFSDSSGRKASLSPFSKKRMKRVAALRGDTLTENATFIKMDVEGAEREAIKGCAQSLRNGSKLAAALYHRSEDMFDLPLLVHEINPSLRMYIRHHLYLPAWETNLYCTP